MDEFFIDKKGDDDIEESNIFNKSCKSVTNKKQIDLPQLSDFFENTKQKLSNHISNNHNLDNTYILNSYTNSNKDIDMPFISKILKRSVIRPGFEKQHSLPSIKSNKSVKLKKQKLMKRTKGDKWFGMPAPEVTEEIKNDFRLLKMRSALDKTHVYKNNTFTTIPKYFQVGKVLDSPADFYNNRIVKSQRKKTIVDELLADAECKKYQKKKYKEIVDSSRKRRRHKQELQKKKNKNKKHG